MTAILINPNQAFIDATKQKFLTLTPDLGIAPKDLDPSTLINLLLDRFRDLLTVDDIASLYEDSTDDAFWQTLTAYLCKIEAMLYREYLAYRRQQKQLLAS